MLNLYRGFMYKLNFNHLKYFLTIAEEGTIVKASKILNITQPALSHQLKLLEEDIDKKLFDRVGKRLILNKNGEMVKEYASKIFRHSEEMLQLLKSDAVEHIKILKIGTLPEVSSDFVHDFIRPLLRNPHIKVQVFQKDQKTLHKDILDNKLDLILSDSPYSGRSKKLIGHRIYQDEIVCVASSKQLYKGRFPKLLSDKKVLNFTSNVELGKHIEDYLEGAGVSTNIVAEIANIPLLKSCAKKDGIAAFLPKSSIKDELKNKELFKLGSTKDLHYEVWAIAKSDIGHENIIYQTIKRYI